MHFVHEHREEASFQSFPWTIANFDLKENWWLNEADMAIVSGDPKACRKKRRLLALVYWQKRFWRKNFVVIRPSNDVAPDEVWYLGWLTKDGYHISKIPLVGPVRKLRYPDRTAYFGLGSDHKQLKVLKIGFGSVNESGNFARYPLI